MMTETKRYTITKIDDPDGDEFSDYIEYCISLKDGYVFPDGSAMNYASSIDDLRNLIADIKKATWNKEVK